ncbi:MAG TPA: mycothione reductase [Nocardioidaceae bacterium]|nr:mycothione reductase [Nocardioidaceae bacterium]
MVVIGTGSGNSIVDKRFAGRRVAMVEQGSFGGTCLNVGCIPTKMFVYPADLALAAQTAPRLGVDTRFDGAHWPEIRNRVFGRIDPISTSGRSYRADGSPHVTLFEGHARFVGERTLTITSGDAATRPGQGDREVTITGDQVVIAAGGRPVVPDVEGLQEVGFHTSDTVMRIDELPQRLLILGGGYVAAEFAHVFGSLGSRVTIVNRSAGLLTSQDEEISRRFTQLGQRQWDVHLGRLVVKVERYDGGVRAHLDDGGTLEADVVLVATGRRSNADRLDVGRGGVEVDADDVIVVDGHQHTSADGVWALGDVANHVQLKHVSNSEARVIQHNLLHLDDPAAWLQSRRGAVPSAVFSSPQVASVGLTEREAVARGVRFVTARQEYAGTAYGWAMEDTTSFAKVLADPDTGMVLGAHIIGPQASNLLQPLVQAMSFDQRAGDVARGQYWIHPALMEVVENLLLALPQPTGDRG